MSASHRLAALAVGISALAPVTAHAMDDFIAQGWKWEQGNWKVGCNYDIQGKVGGGVFRSDEQRKNPDTLERDHAMLIVNRLDDLFARKRSSETGADEMKCKRSMSISSTAWLFPACPSPNLNDFGSSIR
jgi:hypothetical protein